MRSVALLEAKDTFSELVAEAGRGESIVITENGRPVATLNPPPPDDHVRARMQAAINDIEQWREENPHIRMTREEILSSIREGRR